MNELFNNIFEQYAIYAIMEINPNLPTFDYNFQKICNDLDISKWYNLLKLKPLPELEIILQALLHANYDYLNSDPIHSAIVLDLKMKIEEKIHSLKEQKLHSLDVEELKSKIKTFPSTIGYIAIDFDYKAKSQFAAKEFCLASFTHIIHEENCVNWLAKLKYYVEEIKLTILYVYGKNVALFLSKSLNMPVKSLTYYRNKKLECCLECKKKVCTIQQIKIYFKKFHSFSVKYPCH